MVERHKPYRDGESFRSNAILRTNIVLFLLVICVLTIGTGTQGDPAKPGDANPGVNIDQRTVAASGGTIISEGVHLIGADQLHTRGITGKGVKIGIIDLGFAKLDQAIQHRELPKNIIAWNALGFPQTGPDMVSTCRRVTPAELSAASSDIAQGTAVAEIIHDVAPDAELHLYLISNVVELGQAVQKAIEEGVQIISHSVAWLNTNFYDGTGAVDNIVRTARQNGIFWVNGAGDYAGSHYEGTFQDEDGDNFNDTNITLTLHKDIPTTLWLTWDAWPRTNEDFDLMLMKGNKQVAVSKNKQIGTEPRERIIFVPDEDGDYQVQIKWAGQGNPPSNRRIALFVYGGPMQPDTPESSIVAPADCSAAFAVGAVGVNYWSLGKIEPFSSRGPTNAGLQKPDIVAPDYVSTFVYGARWRFGGTAAAAAYVTGAAALLLSEDISRTPYDLERILKKLAIPRGDPNIYGAGLLNLRTSPIAAFTAFPSPTVINQAITFDASNSSDPDGNIVKYEWEFGDGTTGEGKVVTHAFSTPGTYMVKLTVTDNNGATASIEKEVKVFRYGGEGGPA